MSSKAQRLLSLFNFFQSKNFLPLFVLTEEDFNNFGADVILKKISDEVGNGNYAVRSSAIDEDQELSQAGKYLSVMGVNQSELVETIRKVFLSYGKANPKNEVFIQAYVTNSNASGVLFTKDPNTGSNYYVVNFEAGSDTEKITSGRSNGRTFVLHKSTRRTRYHEEFPWFSDLIDISNYCVDFFNDDSLDIEFAIIENRPIILQVRHLSMVAAAFTLEASQQLEVLSDIKNKVSELQERNPFLMGETTVLGVMPDWNPAELIGIRPNTLALSIFKELITDNIWAYERSNLGYRNVRSFPLMVDLAGHPFIDFRTSVNSLLPRELDSLLAEKLANLYISRLSNNPSLHDKVEFEVVISCFTMDFDKKIDLYRENLSSLEVEIFRKSLIVLTRNIILDKPYGLSAILAKHSPIKERFDSISKSNLNDLNKIYWLIEDCKRYGTLPFAGVARAAFVATAILNSLVELGIISGEDLKIFYESINSTATSILPDVKSLPKNDFIMKYGHLRPGTFDITTPNYENAFDLYFPASLSLNNQSLNLKKNLRGKIIASIDESKALNDLDISGEQLIGFAEAAIASREEVKFNFSKNISLILELIASIGKQIGFSREQLSHVHVQVFLTAYKESLSIESEIRKQLMDASISVANSKAIWLPPIICSPEDVTEFEIPKLLPNFVTNRSISAEILNLKTPSENLEGKIILIESADPGFDWIFARNISGIITCYGGANSHMAVRAKEIDIPAAIGVGEEMFGIYCKSAFIQLDCTKKLIEVIR